MLMLLPLVQDTPCKDHGVRGYEALEFCSSWPVPLPSPALGFSEGPSLRRKGVSEERVTRRRPFLSLPRGG